MKVNIGVMKENTSEVSPFLPWGTNCEQRGSHQSMVQAEGPAEFRITVHRKINFLSTNLLWEVNSPYYRELADI